jgi:hypothetical protein
MRAVAVDRVGKSTEASIDFAVKYRVLRKFLNHSPLGIGLVGAQYIAPCLPPFFGGCFSVPAQYPPKVSEGGREARESHPALDTASSCSFIAGMEPEFGAVECCRECIFAESVIDMCYNIYYNMYKGVCDATNNRCD